MEKRAISVLLLVVVAVSLCEGADRPNPRARKYRTVQSSGYGQAKPSRPKPTGLKISEGLPCATMSNAASYVEHAHSYTFPGAFLAINSADETPLAGVGCKKGRLDTSAVQSVLAEGNAMRFSCYDLAHNSRVSLASLSRTDPHLVPGGEEPVRGLHINSLVNGCAWSGGNVLEFLDGMAVREQVPFIDLEDQSVMSCQGPVGEFMYPMRIAYPLIKNDKEMRTWYESKGYAWQGYDPNESMSTVAGAMGQGIMPLPEAEAVLGRASLSDAMAVFMLPHILYKRIFPDDKRSGMTRLSKFLPVSWPEEVFDGWCRVINCRIESVISSDMAFPAYETVSLFKTLQSFLQDVPTKPDTCEQFSRMLEGFRAGSLSDLLASGVDALEEQRRELEKEAEAASGPAAEDSTSASNIVRSFDSDGAAVRARPASRLRSRLMGDIERGAEISRSEAETTPKSGKFRSRLMGDIERSSGMGQQSSGGSTVSRDADGTTEFLELETRGVDICHSQCCLLARRAVYSMVFLHLLKSSHVDDAGIDLEAMNRQVEARSFFIQLKEERFRIKWSESRRQLLHAFLAMTNRYSTLGTFRKVFAKQS